MLALRIILLMVHITAAAFLFGGSAGVARPLRRTIDLGGKAFLLAAEDALRRGRMLGVSSIMTTMTGIGLMFATYQGFGPAPKNFHAALGLILVSIAVSATILRPATAAVVQLARVEPLDRTAVRAKLKRIAMGQGIMHLLWVLILLLMLVRF